jgi:hypothetical protein
VQYSGQLVLSQVPNSHGVQNSGQSKMSHCDNSHGEQNSGQSATLQIPTQHPSVGNSVGIGVVGSLVVGS